MRVLYDYQAFMQRQGGVSRYFSDLVGALEEMEGFQAILPALFSDNEYLGNKMTLLTKKSFKGKVRVMRAANLLLARRALNRTYDVFHPTYYQPYFLRRLKKPFVITVHDMTHEILGEPWVRDDGTARNKKIVCRRAARIIAVSRNTKRDLCRLLAVAEEKVEVIPHATTMCYQGEPRLHERPYLLFVGARSGYKNFHRFLEAAAPLLKRYSLDLVCAGGGSLSSGERDAIGSHDLSGQVRHFVSLASSQLASLYHFATLFCYPSLYEGFGIPLLEAFACGCPVAASATSSVPEVAGEAAEMFDPESVKGMRASLERVILSAPRAAELVAAGKARVRAFSWKETARKTLQVYQEAVEL